jgi:hypothetical protein
MPTTQGSTSIKDWLEQKVPYLVSYPLQDFRVHLVEKKTRSRIPDDLEVVVIDVGDSALAPHQCAQGGGEARKYLYYFRQAGRSEPAPHFYLELLRQRLVNPVLKAELTEIRPIKVERERNEVTVAFDMKFIVRNEGKVTAYKWQFRAKLLDGIAEGREESYKFGDYSLPAHLRPNRGYKPDWTVLPGGIEYANESVAVTLRLSDLTDASIYKELELLLGTLTLSYEIATEMSPGELVCIEIAPYFKLAEIAEFIRTQGILFG